MSDLTFDFNHLSGRHQDSGSVAARHSSSTSQSNHGSEEAPAPGRALAGAARIHRYLHSLRDGIGPDDGFSLVEMLVTLTIMSILLTVSAMMFTSLFQGEIQARQFQAQDATSHEVASFLDSRLGQVTVGDVGLRGTAPGTTQGISVAGDQVVFVAGDHCYRVFHVERTEEINVAVSNDVADDCDAIRPVRGPNQKLADGTYTATPGSDLYDWVLDDPANPPAAGDANVFNLASGVETQPDAKEPSELGLLSFWNAENRSVAFPLHADSSVGDSPSAETDEVAMVRLSAEVLASSSPQAREQQFTKPMELSRDVYLGQS